MHLAHAADGRGVRGRSTCWAPAFARPVIAKRLVEIAQKEGATAICHGATGKGNDQVRFELTIKALAPNMKIIAPWRIWDIKTREEEIDYAEARGHGRTGNQEAPLLHGPQPVAPLATRAPIWRIPWNEPPKDDLCLICKTPEEAPDEPEYIEIDFEQGVPVKVNGVELRPGRDHRKAE